eukprot:CAMPEP_0203674320 /NCGR_PEP_ID=MMETSP0090-20130426/15753_1 /ASSEMBLY_ACC=CAM_ASM_001088 /TAXON_ID=426623 /ORGANISM="Chaetoceros affinis, Strain CCMP159" /LENGTH=400 /DNA_ID=CAMNT_0050540173 /DNA_START=178 /DNA_END=1380 /DNA_ORIENTATION=-
MEKQGDRNGSVSAHVDTAGTTKATATPLHTGNAKWDMMYMRLLAYKKEHNDCLVPNRYKPDTQLGSWVSTQRRHYKLLQNGQESSLTQTRLDLLTNIGFVWATRDPRHVPWDQRYQELLDFKQKFGHCLVPVGYEENVQLSNWVSTQRQEWKSFKLKRQSRLTQERISLLNDIGFVWEAQRGGNRKRKNDDRKTEAKPRTKIPSNTNGCSAASKARTREREIQKLCESGSKRPWIAMFKDYLWLLDEKKNPEDIPGLKQWANDQREEYKREKLEKDAGNLTIGVSSKLTSDQFNLLQSINFDWTLSTTDSPIDDNDCVATRSEAVHDESNKARKSYSTSADSQIISNVVSHEMDSTNSYGQRESILHTQDYRNSTKHHNDTDTAIEVDVAQALFSLGSKP